MLGAVIQWRGISNMTQEGSFSGVEDRIGIGDAENICG